ncbi:hypothetical protein L861_06965 [Litchfieldella anticariensis FP35 = DSM 16096]|uniref:Uncharacterized protein n=1 Tax=Litchfieldella anticariensis (strain DSM 16096 / CECT 5854 / CIP 108499 / LMG 22089 / FP35) TaxID=1121939 RepID=S2KIN4_LITA3|nr:hypothetical protein L861_06965 [Halomonas anticariensis FP35 = DSM 16096]
MMLPHGALRMFLPGRLLDTSEQRHANRCSLFAGDLQPYIAFRLILPGPTMNPAQRFRQILLFYPSRQGLLLLLIGPVIENETVSLRMFLTHDLDKELLIFTCLVLAEFPAHTTSPSLA